MSIKLKFLLKFFNILFWTVFLFSTDAYYIIYLIISILGSIALWLNQYKNSNPVTQTENRLIMFFAAFFHLRLALQTTKFLIKYTHY